MDAKSKRARGSNFTKEEELLLVRTVAKYKNIIECKATDKVNNKEKNEIWQKIMHHVNANNSSVRTGEQLRMKYENLKAKARKVAAQNKCLLTGTGGGPGQIDALDPVLEAILEIINKKTVFGMHSPWDNDSTVTQHLPIEEELSKAVNSDIMILEKEVFPTCPSETITVEVDKEVSWGASTSFEPTKHDLTIHDNDDTPVPSTSEAYNSKEKQSIWAETATPSTSKTTSYKRKKDDDQNVDNPEVPSVSKIWDTYTPIKLKTPMSKKLRCKGTSIKDVFYEKKNMYAEESIKKLKLEQENLIIQRQRDSDKEQREKEEHMKRMELLVLEIEIKRQMLQK